MAPFPTLWQREGPEHYRDGATPTRALLPIDRCPACEQDVYCTGRIVEIAMPFEQNPRLISTSPRRIEMSHYVPYRTPMGWVRHIWSANEIHIPYRWALHVTVRARPTPEFVKEIIGEIEG